MTWLAVDRPWTVEESSMKCTATAHEQPTCLPTPLLADVRLLPVPSSALASHRARPPLAHYSAPCFSCDSPSSATFPLVAAVADAAAAVFQCSQHDQRTDAGRRREGQEGKERQTVRRATLTTLPHNYGAALLHLTAPLTHSPH